jgi:hypothetical protein
VQLTPITATFRPVLYLRSAACEGTETACGVAAFSGDGVALGVPALPAGEHFLWVDGAAGTAGSFLLDAALTP